jgi:hypothetical protein
MFVEDIDIKEDKIENKTSRFHDNAKEYGSYFNTDYKHVSYFILSLHLTVCN